MKAFSSLFSCKCVGALPPLQLMAEADQFPEGLCLRERAQGDGKCSK
jgi:hypothetical protein